MWLIWEFGKVASVGAFRSIDHVVGSYLDYLICLGPVSAVIGSMLVGRVLVKSNLKERWLTWLRIPAAVFMIAVVLSALRVPSYYKSPIFGEWAHWRSIFPSYLSPNRKWVAYQIYRLDQPTRLVFLNTANRRIVGMWVENIVGNCAWSADSKRFAYMTISNSLKIVYLGRTASIERSVTPLPSFGMVSWSPAGDRVGVLSWDDKDPESRVTTVDIRTGAVHAITYRHKFDMQGALAMPAGTPVPVFFEDDSNPNMLLWVPESANCKPQTANYARGDKR
jgi:hypothetical protein